MDDEIDTPAGRRARRHRRASRAISTAMRGALDGTLVDGLRRGRATCSNAGCRRRSARGSLGFDDLQARRAVARSTRSPRRRCKRGFGRCSAAARVGGGLAVCSAGAARLAARPAGPGDRRAGRAGPRLSGRRARAGTVRADLRRAGRDRRRGAAARDVRVAITAQRAARRRARRRAAALGAARSRSAVRRALA